MLTKTFFSLGVCSSRRICPFCHLFIIKLRKGHRVQKNGQFSAFPKVIYPKYTYYKQWFCQLQLVVDGWSILTKKSTYCSQNWQFSRFSVQFRPYNLLMFILRMKCMGKKSLKVGYFSKIAGFSFYSNKNTYLWPFLSFVFQELFSI